MITGGRLLGGRLPAAVEVDGDHGVGAARRLAVAAAQAQGFPPDHEGRAAIVATEMATNLVKYARAGRLFVRLIDWGGITGVDLVAVDSGPGMADARASLVDGFSTGGTLGGGLGAIARLSDLFDIHSTPGAGTIVMARLWAGNPPGRDRRFLVGPVTEAKDGELVTGDGWAVEQDHSRLAMLVADGLGHGPAAAEAAAAAIAAFRDTHSEAVETILAAVHERLRPTRGAAVAVMEVDAAAGRIRFGGVGNISVRLLGGERPRSLLSQFGIAGHHWPRLRVLDERWDPTTVLVAHSDGLSERWDLAGLRGVEWRHPLLVAAAVWRDARRRPDDATVVAVRAARPDEDPEVEERR